MRDLTLKCWAHAVLLVVLLLISLRPALAQEALRLATLEPSVNREALEAEKAAGRHKPVSYTHLTLPTILLV